ncbi:TetR/AcrR family transcriptional regulator [Streptomyces sp. TLI_146]|uniref:TetR/AcrR family transcriptional regulator n=1 Tax=Streptomyces sp. TLI_146 TaxID=1938858 RepID=UPI000C7033AE|nr:TetR/AcrR family transcriptional regulator [Streptomyces sp. TLI_146]PKV83933.1 TetR family transcriptional regulator [Streptomyces sp. TLI_146]
MDSAVARERVLDAAGTLFYERGIQSVGMDEIRSTSGVSLKRLYALFPAKDHLVEAYLERRDTLWRGRLAEYVERHAEPEERILAVFDHLRRWFGEPGFRGCAWINAYGELGASSERVAVQARAHKNAFRAYLGSLVADAGLPDRLADHLTLLAEGAMVTAGIFHSQEPALQAREAAAALLAAARG